ncbi:MULTISPECIES: hypothetical protein [Gordonia]|nr:MULTISPECIES: hypothetical protein [Gordonia]MBD0023220.1 hypothetical protein [Gordonia sp. (in: high G+C Gram-positive bacteria)]
MTLISPQSDLRADLRAPETNLDAARIRNDYRLLRTALLLVGCYVFFGLLGFAVFAGFWPPPGPDMSAAEIHSYFVEHQTGLTIGMVMMAFAAPFYAPWSVAISRVISRMESPIGGLAQIQLIGGVLTAVVTLVPATIWLTAALRADEYSAEIVQLFYHFGWTFFDTTYVCSVLQCVAIGVAILCDRRMRPLLPKWFAWCSFLTAACYVPLSLMPFFRTGPFAWNGIVSFWVVFVEFFVFTAMATFLCLHALRRLEAEDLLAVSDR